MNKEQLPCQNWKAAFSLDGFAKVFGKVDTSPQQLTLTATIKGLPDLFTVPDLPIFKVSIFGCALYF